MKKGYRDVFPKRNTFLAVVHAEDVQQAERNTFIAQQNGADGVFLINHSISPTELARIYFMLLFKFPSFWMGMNLLGLNPIEAVGKMPYVGGGLWVDDAGVKEEGNSPHAEEFANFRKRSIWEGLYFGGVAFKYQEEIRNPSKAAVAAVPYVDVITTSGAGTGFAPEVEKIEQMKLAIGDHPLAIASGITPENVRLYKNYTDCFLVATGISDSHTELNPRRVSQLARMLQ